MRWIPKVLAGTCVVVAAALTAVPVTAGLADLVLGPGPNSTKRNAQPELTSMRTPAAPVTARTEESTITLAGISTEDYEVIEGTIVDDSAVGTSLTGTASANTGSSGAVTPNGSAFTTSQAAGRLSAGTDLVAATAADARTRIADLAADLQAGVSAGEFTQADADRVVADMAGYIQGTRTWPERFPA
ncbi:hypothetical protein BI49514_00783 [Brevibacterium iodinum ATCC 49514]|uniref:Uncharacterized protein n=1 Tax=Brevibacterium iodinum ATCC 49514 TaxID=1255616 RepID=A0A2H1ICC5_9MICO|nr:hypothetical protein [Brevibacterium iodinum]SMX72760.1 hypothetical protein BI49514_00783 [Brevibacterium iodinum ATCC 49514]SUW13148.1 Uncharacterised protein [Brevibacterium iodinum]